MRVEGFLCVFAALKIRNLHIKKKDSLHAHKCVQGVYFTEED